MRDILLVDDNPGDVHLIKEAFEARAIPGTLHAVQTGEEALDWLYQRGDFAEAPLPEVVLLDLNLPSTDGQTVLEEIKSDPQLKRIPVIILTGSKSETELNAAYEEHANACLVKPVGPDEFADLIQASAEFWVSIATLPTISETTGGPHG